MTHLTIKDRARTFPLDQLLDARRRGVAICLYCAAESKPPLGSTLCPHCGAFNLRDPDDIIVLNRGPK
jgi:ribosomal protein L40E